MEDYINEQIQEHIAYVLAGLDVFSEREDLLIDLFNHVEAELLTEPMPITDERIIKSAIGFMENLCADAISEAQLEQMANEAQRKLN